MTEEKGYQGWTNYETWATALWLDNEQGDQEYWIEAAVDAIRNPKISKLTDSDMTAYYLGQRMKEELDDNKELPELPGFYADLLNGALSEVNWREIAEHYIETAQENMPEESTDE